MNISGDMKRTLLVLGLAASQCPQSLWAQDTPAEMKNEAETETIVVTGSRKSGTKALDAAAPVDVVFGEDLASQGDSDLSNLLRTTIPSYNVSTQPISDAGTLVRPFNLRGLPPDSTLVLVNGKRRHRSAVISFLGQGVADGAQGPDISVIPAIALQRVEVLRDGAAAQYGSDAIAGVVNFVLKDDQTGGSVQAKFGSFYEGDGTLMEYSGNVGFPLFENGFGNFSFELSETGATSRSVQRDNATILAAQGVTGVEDPAQVWGQPKVRDNVKMFANFGQELGKYVEFYALGNYASRRVEGGFYFRDPNSREGVYVRNETDADGNERRVRLVGDLDPNNDVACLQLPLDDPSNQAPECFSFADVYPEGFTPQFGGELKDQSAVAGFRGEFGPGVTYDLSSSYGQNRVDFFINNTVNASLGPDSPRSFDPGSYIQTERQFNFDMAIPVPVGPIDLNIAAGFETRIEEFEIEAGEEASYVQGPLTNDQFSIGSNGFSGFTPDTAGKFSRRSDAVYLDLESDITQMVKLGVAGRWEDYEDFGFTQNGKASARVRLNQNWALRSTVGTGFRAPTPGQSNVKNITTAIEDGQLSDRGTIPPTSPLAQIRGGEQLRPETSVNRSFGTMFTANKFRATLDYFRIDVEDRITQSSNQNLSDFSEAERAQMEAQGIDSNLSSFRFYTNDFSTRTQGVDLVMSRPFKLAGGVTTVSFAGNWTETKVKSYTPLVLDSTRIRQLEEGLPAYRYNMAAVHMDGSWRTMVRLNYFDGFYEAHMDDGSFPIDAGEEYTLDLEVGYNIGDRFSLVVGAQNALNEYPDHNPYRGTSGAKYPETSPMGFNGGFYYSRLVYHL